MREENRVLRSRVDQQRLILSPEERSQLLAIGARLEHRVKALVMVVQFRTYQRWWEDSMRYGFLGAGGRVGLRDRIMKLRVGDPVLAYVKGSGYVGEAVVEATATLIGDFVVKAEGKRLLDLPMEGAVWPDRIHDDVNGEFCVAVKWTRAVAKEDAVCSHLAQRGTVCKMRIPEQVAEVREKLAEADGSHGGEMSLPEDPSGAESGS